jgi:predicted DNA-binding transcriptional regulator AlpA
MRKRTKPAFTLTARAQDSGPDDPPARAVPSRRSPGTYALLSVAESLLTHQQLRRAGSDPADTVDQKQSELLTVAEVAEWTRLSAGTLRYWRALGERGPASFKLGRRVMYRRADVEKWLEDVKTRTQTRR